MKKKDVILLLLFLLLIGGFWYVWKNYPKEVVKIETVENEKKIDSLINLIKVDSLVIDSLKEVKNKVEERIIVKVKETKSLPSDSTVKLFHKNILNYGEVGDINSPKLQEDSTVLCDIDNLKGANVITTKYEGKVEECETLQKIIQTEEEMIEKKDSIIEQNSIILNKTMQGYDQELTNLNKQLKKEKRKRTMTLTGGGILLGILGITIFLK